MFNYAIFRKTFRDSQMTLVMSAIAMVGFVVLFVWAMLNLGEEVLQFVSKVPFIARIFEMSFGINVSGEFSANIMFAVCFTHGVVLALTWTAIISAATRVTAGEVERGTADMLLTLPVTRTEVHLSTTLVWVLISVVLSTCPIVGIFIAKQIFETKEFVEVYRYVPPAVNFFCLNLAVGGIASMVGAIVNRRGLAVGVTVGIILSSAVLNFLEPFIAAVKQIGFLSLLSYFRPVDIVRAGEWPLTHLIILTVIAIATWVIGLIAFVRKDIPTA